MPELKKNVTDSENSPESDLEEQIRFIRFRAFQLYELRGKEDGHDVDDWLRAEEENMREKTRAVAA